MESTKLQASPCRPYACMMLMLKEVVTLIRHLSIDSSTSGLQEQFSSLHIHPGCSLLCKVCRDICGRHCAHGKRNFRKCCPAYNVIAQDAPLHQPQTQTMAHCTLHGSTTDIYTSAAVMLRYNSTSAIQNCDLHRWKTAQILPAVHMYRAIKVSQHKHMRTAV